MENGGTGRLIPLKTAKREVFDKPFFALVDDIAKVRRVEQGDIILRGAAKLYGLKHVASLGIKIPGLTDSEPFGMVTYSQEWRQRYLERNYVTIDPVVRLGLTGLLPLDWALIDRSDRRVRQFFGEAADAGVGRQGLSFPIRGRNQEIALFSITSDVGEREWQAVKRSYMRDFQLIAHYCHAMITRVAGARPETALSAPLSARERECLHWASVGKSTWETSVILGVSERSVKFYLDQVRHKLNCVNKTHAVARAMELGLIRAG